MNNKYDIKIIPVIYEKTDLIDSCMFSNGLVECKLILLIDKDLNLEEDLNYLENDFKHSYKIPGTYKIDYNNFLGDFNSIENLNLEEWIN